MNDEIKKNGINETNGDLEQTTENDVTTTVTTSPFCRSDCKICNSDHMIKIHEFIKLGKTYRDICDYLKMKQGFEISPASITRHMTNYREALRQHAQQRELQKFDDEADELIRHQKQATEMADSIYEMIRDRIRDGTIEVSISDWEKIVKLRHSVLRGEAGAMDDLVAVFQQATDKYGVNLQQGVLFKNNRQPQE